MVPQATTREALLSGEIAQSVGPLKGKERFIWRSLFESCRAGSVVLEVELATQEESVLWNLVALAVQEYGYSPSKLKWDEGSRTYCLTLNRLGISQSKRVITIFQDQFSASVADNRLHEAIVQNLLDAVRGAVPGSAWKTQSAPGLLR
jgi:hypothetical protein